MKEIVVNKNEAGQRLDKLLGRYLKLAPKSFLYKMLRKKNITLNGKKATGAEQTGVGDVVKIFLADETYEKFSGAKKQDNLSKSDTFLQAAPLTEQEILYENEHIILMNKAAGVLSQKAQPQDVSMNERLIAYLFQKGEATAESLETFRPAVCNRLDRNTSGILIGGKTLAGLQEMSRMLKDRSMQKYYLCLVRGQLTQKQRLHGYLKKEESANRVTILDQPCADAKEIATEYTPLQVGREVTLLEVYLITGRSHQIRAHLASIGHPIIGDFKYGDPVTNRKYRERFGVQAQLLHAGRLKMPELAGELAELSGCEFTAPLPKQFRTVMKGTL